MSLLGANDFDTTMTNELLTDGGVLGTIATKTNKVEIL